MRSVVPVSAVVVFFFAGVAAAGCGQLPPSSSSSAQTSSSRSPRSSGGTSGSTSYLGLSSSTGAPVCSGDLASDSFAGALCVCGDASFSGELFAHGLAGGPASVGANGAWQRAGESVIAGDLIVGGEMSGAGDDAIDGALVVGGALTHAGLVQVGGDARIGGDAIGAGGVSVAGELTVPEDALLIGVTAASVVRAPVEVAPPCVCEADVDIAGFIDQARADNDNASAAGAALGALDAGAGDVELQLGDGRFFVEQIAHAGSVRIVATGAARLFVAGDLSAAGDLEVVLDGDASSFDLFVGGDVSHAGDLHLGDVAAPARVRVYINGAGGLSVAGEHAIAGAVSLPNGELHSAGDLVVSGAVVARSLAAAGVIDIGFDDALVDLGGGSCEPPAADDGNADGGDGSDGAGDDVGDPERPNPR